MMKGPGDDLTPTFIIEPIFVAALRSRGPGYRLHTADCSF